MKLAGLDILQQVWLYLKSDLLNWRRSVNPMSVQELVLCRDGMVKQNFQTSWRLEHEYGTNSP